MRSWTTRRPRTTYMVTLTATDSFGASSSIMVTIMVKDVDEEPEISEGRAGNIRHDSSSGGTLRTGGRPRWRRTWPPGPDASMATWSLEGDDAGDFMNRQQWRCSCS